MSMNKEEFDIVLNHMREANQFAKDVRTYLYEIEKQRPLTKEEKALWDKTHYIHQHMNDAFLMLQKDKGFFLEKDEMEEPELD